jgi:hypothetical protein
LEPSGSSQPARRAAFHFFDGQSAIDTQLVELLAADVQVGEATPHDGEFDRFGSHDQANGEGREASDDALDRAGVERFRQRDLSIW